VSSVECRVSRFRGDGAGFASQPATVMGRTGGCNCRPSGTQTLSKPATMESCLTRDSGGANAPRGRPPSESAPEFRGPLGGVSATKKMRHLADRDCLSGVQSVGVNPVGRSPGSLDPDDVAVAHQAIHRRSGHGAAWRMAPHSPKVGCCSPGERCSSGTNIG
jgi:hypothetical protein